MPTRGLAILAVVTVTTVAASGIAVDKRYRQTVLEARGGEAVFPAFRGHTGSVAGIEVGRAGAGFALERRGDGWANTGLGGYPARAELIETVLSEVAGLGYLEPKTARTALFPKLGVEDAGPGAGSTGLTLRDGDGGVLADLIVGRARPRTANADRAVVYIRLPGRERAWLAEGILDVHRDAAGWSDREIVDIDARSVRSMTVRHEDGEVVDLYRAESDDRKLTLRNLPAGAAVAHQHQIDFMAGLLQGLSVRRCARRRALGSRGRTRIRSHRTNRRPSARHAAGRQSGRGRVALGGGRRRPGRSMSRRPTTRGRKPRGSLRGSTAGSSSFRAGSRIGSKSGCTTSSGPVQWEKGRNSSEAALGPTRHVSKPPDFP